MFFSYFLHPPFGGNFQRGSLSALFFAFTKVTTALVTVSAFTVDGLKYHRRRYRRSPVTDCNNYINAFV